ncbi:MAG: hypothetical protein AAFY11_10895, partial [Cyanobacteria bacterium J06641_5]
MKVMYLPPSFKGVTNQPAQVVFSPSLPQRQLYQATVWSRAAIVTAVGCLCSIAVLGLPVRAQLAEERPLPLLDRIREDLD